ncbi:surfeit locus protein [Plectosphaerella plurivora]|uniref:SURF1-like protein n=1 Tax=Plectosphaerella plurivora TaxID=936078 RepID=A0A9P9A3Y5_9PEZI|nr:surfeit locus protein [Plectosphaerella plurivora]
MKASISALRLLPRAGTRQKCSSPSSWAVRPRASNLTSTAAPRRSFRTTSAPRAGNKKKGEDGIGDEFFSIIDNPPELVRVGGNGSKIGLFFLALVPVTAFILGTWQVKRLGWKTELIARLEDRLVREPLPLPPRIDPEAVPEFDFRRVYATGILRHDKEMLIGPRMREGEQGYMVVTPLERLDEGSTVLVNRGWISKKMGDQRRRDPSALPREVVTIEGLLREPWKKNMFTPDNRPDKWEFYFPDVKQMAELAGSQPIWIEATMEPEYLKFIDMQARGDPIGRAAEVNLRNNHAQYIFTWYGLAVATSIMLYMVTRKPPGTSEAIRRVRMNKNW